MLFNATLMIFKYNLRQGLKYEEIDLVSSSQTPSATAISRRQKSQA
jgi:hypothetical protein